MFVDNDADGIITPGIDEWIPVVGIDGIEEAKGYIDSGYLYGTVINDSERMSEVLVELALAIINGTSLDDLSFDLVDGKYVWVDYQKYEKEVLNGD